VVFGFPWDFFLPHLSLRMTTATVLCGLCCFYFSQVAVAACRCWRSVLPVRTVSMQVAATHTPQAAVRLLAICPDVAKLLEIVALRKGILWFIHLYLDGNVAGARESEDVLRLCRPRQCY
jgi:hypothetical protein